MSKHGPRVYEQTEDDVVPIVTGWQFGHSIFKCGTCNTRRPFGFGTPERQSVLIGCSQCKKVTWHVYLGMSNAGGSTC